MIWRIYKYTNTITGQSYIGQTSMNVNKRAKRGKCYHKGTPFREAIDKYGFDNFEQSILRLCTSQEEADEYERHFIEKYNSVYPNGYNLQSGGKDGQQLHIRTKQKLSECTREAMKSTERRQIQSENSKNRVITEEWRHNISIANRGKNNWSKGQKWFNDGTKNIRAYSCPEGFIEGMLKK